VAAAELPFSNSALSYAAFFITGMHSIKFLHEYAFCIFRDARVGFCLLYMQDS